VADHQTYRDLSDEVATLRQELDRSEVACASAMAEVEALTEERDAALARPSIRELEAWAPVVIAARRVVQLVDHNASDMAVGDAIGAMRRVLDGGGQ
jgi:hypothetical protein